MGWDPFLENLWRETGTVHHRITSFSRRATATYASIRVILALMEGGGTALSMWECFPKGKSFTPSVSQSRRFGKV